MSKKRTHVAFVLDSSGSMNSMSQYAIELFNNQRQAVIENRKKAGKTRCSLITFGSIISPVHVVSSNVKPKNVPTLDQKTYQPYGLTPLRDAMGRAMGLLEDQDDGGKDTAFLMVVVTDGLENNSTDWSAERLSKKIAKLQRTDRWTFAVYGASDIDFDKLVKEGGLSRIPKGNFGSFTNTADGWLKNAIVMNASTAQYFASRGVGSTSSVNYTDSEDKGWTIKSKGLTSS